MNWIAEWIWTDAGSVGGYNVAAVFRREFELSDWESARLAVTADSWYRLKINGQWVNDGPCRSYPAHYQYDLIDVSAHLRLGRNDIEITVRYFGIGTFHQIPRQAGLLAQLEVEKVGGGVEIIGTDGSWRAAALKRLVANTAKISIQQEPFELFDSTLANGEFAPATVLFKAGVGPWRGLHARDCRLLTRKEFNLKSFVGASLVSSAHWSFSIPAQKILYPGTTSANAMTNLACGVVFNVYSTDSRRVTLALDNLRAAVNGVAVTEGEAELKAGKNLLVLLTREVFTHRKDLSVAIRHAEGLRFENPLQEGGRTVCFLRFPAFLSDREDMPFMNQRADMGEISARAEEVFAPLMRLDDVAKLGQIPGLVREDLAAETFSADGAHWHFRDRDPIPAPEGTVVAPENLLYAIPDCTPVNPAEGKDIELLYDLGEQNCGYWDMELTAAAGTVVDIFAVEYIAADGSIQHTGDNRNGLRYICHDGVNRYTSLKRRSGRYLFVTLRRLAAPVKLHFLRLVESTYPVEFKGSFECNDFRLNRIWDISARTLKLCMEDTFTDCPLYEQTLWVGDARNESLFSYPVFGGWDLARRCIRLAGHSLDKYPITGCQVPSGWDCLLPAWSFLWGISVWEYYFETADRDFLVESWPWVEKNMAGAAKHIDPATGLFSMPAWNLFDWSRTDTAHKTLLFNSIFMCGAIDAAVKVADVLGKKELMAEYRALRDRLSMAVNRTWLAARQAFPDSIHGDGQPSGDIAAHTSFLSILYGVVDADKFAAARQNTLAPGADMIKVSSPFASLYYYETLEKLGEDEEILAAIYRDYQPMLDLGATTVWETYAGSFNYGQPGFPTRSHCHGWSAAPLMFLNRIVIGLKMAEAGAKKFTVSPLVAGLEHAAGRRATVKGAVAVRWYKQDGELRIDAEAPEGVELEYAVNASHRGLKVFLNGREQ